MLSIKMQYRRAFRPPVPLGALVVSLCAGCSSPTSQNGHVSKDIGPEGGSIQYENLSLVIPPGAMSETRTVTITIVSDSGPPGFAALSPIFKIGPAGLQFSSGRLPEVHFKVGDAADATDNATVVWSQDDGPSYEALETNVDGGVASATPHHFSKTALVSATSKSRFDWAMAPWSAGTCLKVTAPYHNSSGWGNYGVDLQDPTSCLAQDDLRCPFTTCQVVENCRTSKESNKDTWGNNVCIVELDASAKSTGRWLFVAHLESIEDAAKNGPVAFQGKIATMGNNGLIVDATTTCKRIHFHVEQGQTPGDDMRKGGSKWPSPPFLRDPAVHDLVCAGAGSGSSSSSGSSSGSTGSTGSSSSGTMSSSSSGGAPPCFSEGFDTSGLLQEDHQVYGSLHFGPGWYFYVNPAVATTNWIEQEPPAPGMLAIYQKVAMTNPWDMYLRVPTSVASGAVTFTAIAFQPGGTGAAPVTFGLASCVGCTPTNLVVPASGAYEQVSAQSMVTDGYVYLSLGTLPPGPGFALKFNTIQVCKQ